MKKIENFIAVAPKLKSGNIEYCLWTDEGGALYIQMLRNLTKTKKPGTCSKLLFRVADYLNDCNTVNTSTVMRGFNCITFSEEIAEDKDNAKFIEAVLKHLFPKGTEVQVGANSNNEQKQ